MDQRELTEAMERFASNGKWIVSMGDLRDMFDDRSQGLKVMMHRHVNAGIVTRVLPGIYMHANARRQGKACMGQLLRCIRPNDTMYVSLDSALREHGRNAAGDPGTLHLMTSGLSYTYKCESGLFKALFGVQLTAIEFRHTERLASALLEASWDTIHGRIPLASLGRALEDMTRTCRPLPPGDSVKLVQGVPQPTHALVAAA